MTLANSFVSDIAFTPAVKEMQAQRGSRSSYARMESGAGWQTRITPDLAGFIHQQRSVFLATANGEGQPYIQHRGGPEGFLRVLDDHTLGFADYAGNKQYITMGNLSENPKAYLFLIDYELRQRVKLWGVARTVEGDAELLKKLSPVGYKARVERALIFEVTAWDVNCPQHIPRRYEASDVDAMLAERDQRIQVLEEKLRSLTGVEAASLVPSTSSLGAE